MLQLKFAGVCKCKYNLSFVTSMRCDQQLRKRLHVVRSSEGCQCKDPQGGVVISLRTSSIQQCPVHPEQRLGYSPSVPDTRTRPPASSRFPHCFRATKRPLPVGDLPLASCHGPRLLDTLLVPESTLALWPLAHEHLPRTLTLTAVLPKADWTSSIACERLSMDHG